MRDSLGQTLYPCAFCKIEVAKSDGDACTTCKNVVTSLPRFLKFPAGIEYLHKQLEKYVNSKRLPERH